MTGGDAPLGRGAIERLGLKGDRVGVAGWLLLPGVTIDSFALAVDGREAGELKQVERPDVERVYGWCGGALASGFAGFERAPGVVIDGRAHAIEVRGVRGGRTVARLSSAFWRDYALGLPVPPRDLMLRVSNIDDSETYWTGGLQNAGVVLGALERHAPLPGGRRVLDWGAGCGRITEFLVRRRPGDEIHGCDIDPGNVAWCRVAMPGARFEAVGPAPPTPYADGSFDAATGYSVLTHLERSLQLLWLEEMRRILKPGGVLVASVNGEFAARMERRDGGGAGDLEREGIDDSRRDRNLDGIAPAGYYRATYQTEAYTRRAFGEVFEVVEYVPRVMNHLQDLVVLRKGV